MAGTVCCSSFRRCYCCVANSFPSFSLLLRKDFHFVLCRHFPAVIRKPGKRRPTKIKRQFSFFSRLFPRARVGESFLPFSQLFGSLSVRMSKNCGKHSHAGRMCVVRKSNTGRCCGYGNSNFTFNSDTAERGNKKVLFYLLRPTV